jgi:hypothetical protein
VEAEREFRTAIQLEAEIFCRLQYFPDALMSLKKAKQYGFRFTEAISRRPVFASLVPLQDFKALYEQSPTLLQRPEGPNLNG